MKTFNHAVLKTAIAAAFAFAVGTYGHDEPRAPQRAAANAFERGQSSAVAPMTSGEVTRMPNIPGKHASQMADSRKGMGGSSGIDLAHAPRPVTASKDADFDQKLRENARQFQVAPVK